MQMMYEQTAKDNVEIKDLSHKLNFFAKTGGWRKDVTINNHLLLLDVDNDYDNLNYVIDCNTCEANVDANEFRVKVYWDWDKKCWLIRNFWDNVPISVSRGMESVIDHCLHGSKNPDFNKTIIMTQSDFLFGMDKDFWEVLYMFKDKKEVFDE